MASVGVCTRPMELFDEPETLLPGHGWRSSPPASPPSHGCRRRHTGCHTPSRPSFPPVPSVWPRLSARKSTGGGTVSYSQEIIYPAEDKLSLTPGIRCHDDAVTAVEHAFYDFKLFRGGYVRNHSPVRAYLPETRRNGSGSIGRSSAAVFV